MISNVDVTSMIIGVVLLVAVFEFARKAKNNNDLTKIKISIALWWVLLAGFVGVSKYTALNLYSSSIVALIGCIYTMKFYFDTTKNKR